MKRPCGRGTTLLRKLECFGRFHVSTNPTGRTVHVPTNFAMNIHHSCIRKLYHRWILYGDSCVRFHSPKHQSSYSQIMEVIGPRSVRNRWFISPMECKQPTYVVKIHVLFSDNDWGVLNHLRPTAYLVSTIRLDPEGLTWLGTQREIMGRTVYLYTY